ncbi:MAG: class I SAM-dependent RNA methyltransferase [Asticcacaulis sp.]|nr:class I SAM-dependent RNA methyltransferase [Asticcacaulis sp.]
MRTPPFGRWTAGVAEFEVEIDKVGFQGDGMTADGRAVPMTLPGERVRVATSRDKDGKERVDVLEILTPSPDRVAPPCRHFATCGGCALQHWDMDAYGAWKREVVAAQLRRAGLETEVAPILTTPPASRRRVGLHARKVSPKKDAPVEIGYKMRRSWSLVPIVECPIAEPAIVRALPQLKEMARGLFEHPKSAPILHVTTSQTGLDIDISGVERSKSGGLSADACMQIAMIAGEADFARVTMGDDIVYEARKPRVTFGRAQVGLPQGSFLQASAKSEADMVSLVVDAVRGARVVADLFCGAGTFTFPLAEVATVRAADGAAGAINALKIAIGTAPGLKGISSEVRDLFRRPLMAPELKGLEAVVFDPPRAGAEAQTTEIAASGVSRVVAVSCNPITFVRDAKILMAAGFTLDRVTPIDQFLWSSHVELVAIFSR